MKWLIAYSVRINGRLSIRNAILPEVLHPMNWIAMANREHKDEPDKMEYALVNFWQVTDYEASKWEDDGTGYLSLANEETIKRKTP